MQDLQPLLLRLEDQKMDGGDSVIDGDAVGAKMLFGRDALAVLNPKMLYYY